MGKGGPIWWERGAYLVREGAYLVGGEGLFGGERRANLMGVGAYLVGKGDLFWGGEWGLFGGEGGPI